MELELKPAMKVEDGKHTGVIIALEERQLPHHYIDVVVEFDGGMKLKCGYPGNLTTESLLGDLLAAFGADISTPGTIIDPEKVLIGKKVSFMTLITENKKTKRSYANILRDTMKPVK